jgi:hypothetical protein
VLERLSRVDVPRSVASSDGKGISLTDIVSVLTRVVKEQQETIDALSEKCGLGLSGAADNTLAAD